MTGKPKSWWVAATQALITKHSRPTKDPRHGQTRTGMVVAELVALVEKTSFRKKERFDGNMRMAAVLSYVLALWYLRVHRAKSYDPRRPVALRRGAYWSRMGYLNALFLAITDESEDQLYFPGQRWETPFDPYPTDGYFV